MAACRRHVSTTPVGSGGPDHTLQREPEVVHITTKVKETLGLRSESAKSRPLDLTLRRCTPAIW